MRIYLSHGPQIEDTELAALLAAHFEAGELIVPGPAATADEVRDAVRGTDALAVLIEEGWAEQDLSDEDARPRVELETAFANQIPVVVLHEGRLPDRESLPDSIAPLLDCPAIPLAPTSTTDLLDAAISLSQADRGKLMSENDAGFLVATSCRGAHGDDVRPDHLGHQIIDRVHRTSKAHVDMDAPMADGRESTIDLRLFSVMAVPLEIDGERSVLCVDAPMMRKEFGDRDLTRLTAFVRVAVAAAAVGSERSRAAAGRAEFERDDEAVQFTVFKPKALPMGQWTKMLAFMHLAEAGPDEPDPVEQVRAEAERRLGPRIQQFAQMLQDAVVDIPRETAISFVPDVPGVRFNPPVRRFEWAEDLTHHAEEFELRPEGEPGPRRGALRVLMGLVLVAEIPLRITVTADAPTEPVEPESVSARPLQKVFVSYSHDDAHVAEHMERVASAFRLDYLRDVKKLRAGDFWEPRLLDMIDTADVFQLLWSTNASRSPHVRNEYLHAVGLDRPEHFLVPLYWETPCPERPVELDHIHFAVLPVVPELTVEDTLVGVTDEKLDVTLDFNLPPGTGDTKVDDHPLLGELERTKQRLEELGLRGADDVGAASDQAMLSDPTPHSFDRKWLEPRDYGGPQASGGGGGALSALGCLLALAILATAIWLIFF